MKVKINDSEYAVRPLDEGRVALAGFLAMSSGEPVDIPLTDGTMITGVRSGEIEQIAKQVLTPR